MKIDRKERLTRQFLEYLQANYNPDTGDGLALEAALDGFF
ncbi:MAG: hypothetical protein KatS3mg083_136 [Candidatus Dojkabacteria bacterium]|nr:MAG: hypothetical protein KatS3mg083_136 [Candidatus Dojkabacteria bacterium]